MSDNAFLETIDNWRKLKLEMKEDEAELKDLEALITAMRSTLNVSNEQMAALGMTVVNRKGSYLPTIIPVLKEKGLRDAIAIEEKPIVAKVEEYEAQGLLPEAKDFQTPETEYYKLGKVATE